MGRRGPPDNPAVCPHGGGFCSPDGRHIFLMFIRMMFPQFGLCQSSKKRVEEIVTTIECNENGFESAVGELVFEIR